MHSSVLAACLEAAASTVIAAIKITPSHDQVLEITTTQYQNYSMSVDTRHQHLSGGSVSFEIADLDGGVASGPSFPWPKYPFRSQRAERVASCRIVTARAKICVAILPKAISHIRAPA